MKENNKNPFLEILTYVGLLLWAVAFFFGFNYVAKGSLMVSIPVSVFLLLVMGVLIFAMKKFSRGVQDNAQKAQNTHILASVLYALVVLGTAIFLCHFVKISTEDQTAIQIKAQNAIEELATSYSEEPVSGSYLAWVVDRCDSYRIQLEGEGMAKGTIETRVAELESALCENGFSEEQGKILDFLSSCRYSVNNWVWLTIPNYLSRLESEKTVDEANLIDYSKQSDFTADEPFIPSSAHNYTDLTAPLESISASDLSIYGIILVVILQILILLSYFVGKPDTGQAPVKYKGPWGRSFDANAGTSGRSRKTATTESDKNEDFEG